jgi:AhpD family alkylhydroperoxidase
MYVSPRLRRLYRKRSPPSGASWARRPKRARFPASFKELIAVAIAVDKGCGDCILFHVANAKKHGATRDELSEALVVCIEMGGGPGAVYAARALAAYDEIA